MAGAGARRLALASALGWLGFGALSLAMVLTVQAATGSPSAAGAALAGFARIPIFALEFLSNFMRLLSLSVRLFANILAGHLIILFMSGGLAVLLGLEVLGVFTLPFGIALFLFEVGLVATLQAFIFATLSAIYLGGAVAESH